MKYVIRVYFVLAMFFLFLWIISHSYSKWFVPEGSVLDKYTEQTDAYLLKSVPLDELVKRYDVSYKKLKDYESNKANPELSFDEKSEKEPYKSEIALKDEIHNREIVASQLHIVRYKWLLGLVFAIAGLIIFRKLNELLGLPVMVAAFLEMVVAIAPSRSYIEDFSNVITNKLLLSIITVVLLIIFGYLLSIMKEDEKTEEKKTE